MAEETASGTSKKNLFFVKNSQYNTKSLEVYLARRDYIVYSESGLKESVEKITEIKPQYVFIAWDHKIINIQDLLSQIQSTPDIVIIPYITSTSTSDTSRLAQVDAPIKLFPPLSGPSVQRLILKYEKEIANKSNQKRNLATAPKGSSDKSTVVSAKDGSEGQPQQVYVSKGQKLAELAKMNQASPSLLLPNDVEEAADGSSFFDSITDMTTDPPMVQFSKSYSAKISDFQKHAVSHIFDTKIKTELTEVIETVKEADLENPEKARSCYGVLVQSVDCSGVVLLQSEWSIQRDEAEPALTLWAKELTSYFFKSTNGNSINYEMFQSPVVEVQLPTQLNIFEAITEKSAVHKELLIDDRKTALAFFDLVDNPFNIQPADNASYLSVVPNCFHKSTIVPFDIFLELKENKKIIKYIKAQTEISDKEMDSLKDKRDIPVLIDQNSELAWYKYGLESFLVQL